MAPKRTIGINIHPYLEQVEWLDKNIKHGQRDTWIREAIEEKREREAK